MGREKEAKAHLAALGCLIVLVAGILAGEARRVVILQDTNPMRQIQGAVGGLGLGASASPTWAFNAFDPRLEPHCEAGIWPLAGGPCYSPDHVGPVSDFPQDIQVPVSKPDFAIDGDGSPETP